MLNVYFLRSTAQFELSSPPQDAISALQFAPTSLRLLVASWDKHVYLYDTSAPATAVENGERAQGRLVRRFEHRAPVLDVCFGREGRTGEEEEGGEAYSVGLDWDVRR